MVDKQDAGADGFTWQTGFDAGGDIGCFFSSSSTFVRTTTGILSTTELNHYVFVYDGSAGTDADRLKIYKNAVSQTMTGGTVPTTIPANDATPLWLARASVASGDHYYGGDADVFILASGVSWTQNYVTTMYNNQNAPTTIWGEGTEVPLDDILMGQGVM